MKAQTQLLADDVVAAHNVLHEAESIARAATAQLREAEAAALAARTKLIEWLS